MKRIALFVILCFSVLVKAQSPFAVVRKNMQEGNYSRPLVILDSCTDKNYYKDSALFYKGLVYLKKGNISDAKKNCNALIKTYPAFAEAHYLNGLIQYSDENYGKSIDEFNLALKANPTHIKALYNRSVAFGVLEDYLSAIEDLGTCIELNPNYALAYYSRGYWYEFTGNYIEAAKDYENSIRLDPKNYDAYYGLAFVYQTQKETTKACEVINQAINQGSQIAEELKSNFCR
jgi:tetratricopeptide (TPR) repeat protein